MKNYIVLNERGTDAQLGNSFRVVCLQHAVAEDLKYAEAEALANALNVESAMNDTGFGKVD